MPEDPLVMPVQLQLLLIGDSGVGKSCLLLRFAVSTALGLGQHLAVGDRVRIAISFDPLLPLAG